jgi:REP-associated tyrosine transposase
VPRPHRNQVAGGVYHVTARGVDCSAVYLDVDDRTLYIAVFAKTIARYGWACHIYCLMTTHLHMIVETPRPNLARGIQLLNGVYGRAFNERHGRVGHLFGGRYGSVLIESDEQYAAAWDYVAHNPVKAGLCRRPEDWPWSGIAPGTPLPTRDGAGG